LVGSTKSSPGADGVEDGVHALERHLALGEQGLNLIERLEGFERLDERRIRGPGHLQLIEHEDLPLGEYVRVGGDETLRLLLGDRRDFAGDLLLQCLHEQTVDHPLFLHGKVGGLVQSLLARFVRQNVAADDVAQSRRLGGLQRLGIG
jgi:hypothetical protein